VNIEGLRALTFDTTGTVLDWHSAIHGAIVDAGRTHGLERDWLRITGDYRKRALSMMLNQVNPSYTMDDTNRQMFEDIVWDYGLGVFTVSGHCEALARTRCMARCPTGDRAFTKPLSMCSFYATHRLACELPVESFEDLAFRLDV
jgi:hypothetical protein